MAGYIEDFDHNLRFAFRYSVELDREAIFRAAGLPDDAVVAAYATVDCQQSGVRLSASTALTDDSLVLVSVAVEPGTLAGGVELQRGLALVNAGSIDRVSTAATRSGSRLLEGEAALCRLEGDWSRFPLEAVNFDAAGLPNVPWHLRMSYEDLDDPFLGSVRMLINAGHPAGKAVLEADAPEILKSALRVDLVLSLIHI